MSPVPPPVIPPAVFLQPTCHLHRFHRPSSAIHLSSIVERPERLRAIYLGLSTALARLSLLDQASQLAAAQAISAPSSSDDLVRALEGLGISRSTPSLPSVEGQSGGGVGPATARLVVCEPPTGTGSSVLRSKAVRFVHEPEEDLVEGGKTEDRYLEKLARWAEDVSKRIKEGKSEIPEGLPQGDLYLCTGSLLAITGALVTTTQAVDTVVRSSRYPQAASFSLSDIFSSNLPSSSLTPSTSTQALSTPPLSTAQPEIRASTAFCAIRPPGHHCGEDDPMGFCFVNNVLVGAAHAYLEHNIDRAIILDIDLHHGNGTQDIALRLNSDTYHEELLVEGGKPAPANGKRGMKVFYGSVHDIYSFPCEDGDIDRVKDASVSLASHGQFIENIHLTTYTTEADFYARCYPRYLSLLTKAGEFLDVTGGTEEKAIVFISAGFDASEHESPGMQRHGGHVPTSFYARFHADTVAFARSRAQGRVISVLEGGYGDRALASGALASLVGLADGGEGAKIAKAEEEGWWSLEKLSKLEKSTKPTKTTKRGGPKPATSFAVPSSTSMTDFDPWLSKTIEIFQSIEIHPFFPQPLPALSSATNSPTVATGGRTLRDRSAIQRTEKAGGGTGEAVGGSPRKKKVAPAPPVAPSGGPVLGGLKMVKAQEVVVASMASLAVASQPTSQTVFLEVASSTSELALSQHTSTEPTAPLHPPSDASLALPSPPLQQPMLAPEPSLFPSAPSFTIEPPKKIVLKFIRPTGSLLSPPAEPSTSLPPAGLELDASVPSPPAAPDLA